MTEPVARGDAARAEPGSAAIDRAPPDRRDALIPCAIAAAVLALRAPWLCAVEQDVDGARFVGAVLRFDVTRMHPHPPGYPVYVAPAIVLHRALGGSPALALSLVSALGAALAGIALYALSRSAGRGRLHGVLWAALAVLPPGPALLSTRPGSDALGLGLCLLAYALLARPGTRGALGALACAGLLAGTRHSLAAMVLPAVGLATLTLHRARALRRGCLVMVGAVSSWLLPILAWQGPISWGRAVMDHARGHFGEYGGSAVTDPALGDRARAFADGVVGYGWGAGHWTAATVAGPLALGTILAGAWSLRGSRVSPAIRGLLAGAALYALWVFFAQNVRWAPRHVVALWPVVALLLVEGVCRAARARLLLGSLGGALTLASLLAGAQAVGTQSRQIPAAICLARSLAAVASPRGDLAASAQVPHWVRFRQPDRRVLWTATTEQAERIARDNRWGLLVSTETPGALESMGEGRGALVAACASDPRVHPSLSSLGWVRITMGQNSSGRSDGGRARAPGASLELHGDPGVP